MTTEREVPDAHDDLFDGFVEREIVTDRGTVFARVGGTGPPVLLLHGYPQTHVMWRRAATLLAQRFSVVAADLPGYGRSFRPAPAADHAPHSKRALAQDLVQAMSRLGHERFTVAGHDRGGRVAYRMALDHPDQVAALAVLDVVPTGDVWSRADADLALLYWHWAFLAQPAPLPERLIAADPDAFFDFHVRALGLGRAVDRYPAALMAATEPSSTMQAPFRRSARTTGPVPRWTVRTTRRTAAGVGSGVRCSLCGAHMVRFRVCTAMSSTSGGRGPMT
jgi:haloacetate dehalogenase